ncbi:uncharacterized protein LOC115324279 [Ixodes scapularis]|uniref:uncharacterized protein LOC115324279 n=1 Tax=Ixodes scapularis TaxID=6945 RepID=UPI001AA000CF|nr:uncharacterized protein LOC115324279 [Ixodes scapularis]
MQVLTSFITLVMVPAFLNDTWIIATESTPLRHAHGSRDWQSSTANAPLNLVALSSDPWIPSSSWEAPSSSTSTDAPVIKEQHPATALCGLGGCATTRSINPLSYTMQVSLSYVSSSKKSSNYLLVQLPSLQCCIADARECAQVIRRLLMLSGDVETNPGPVTSSEILSELQKLFAGQTKLIEEVKGLKSQLQITDRTISDLGRRMTDLEGHYQGLSTLRAEVEATVTRAAHAARQVSDLEARVDDTENRSRRKNLIFYGVPDPSPTETFAQSEQRIIRLCSELFEVTLDSKEIERAHRLGRHSIERPRTIIVNFSFFKTKEAILSNGRKLKGTNFSMGEDFSRSVRNARKHLLAFARSKSAPFSLRYKTLLIGSKRYVFDESCQSVKEIS